MEVIREGLSPKFRATVSRCFDNARHPVMQCFITKEVRRLAAPRYFSFRHARGDTPVMSRNVFARCEGLQ